MSGKPTYLIGAANGPDRFAFIVDLGLVRKGGDQLPVAGVQAWMDLSV